MEKLFVMPLVVLCALLMACVGVTAGVENSSLNSVYGMREPIDGPGQRHLAEQSRDAVPQVLSKSKYGNPPVYEVAGRFYQTMDSAEGYLEQGIASWYGSKFHGRLTSSREVYDMYLMTAAHRYLPIPTFVEVTNRKNGKSVIVKVNDRGPFHDDRIIDLSYAAAVRLGVIATGTAPVEVRAVSVMNQATSDPGTHSPTVKKVTYVGKRSVKKSSTAPARLAKRTHSIRPVSSYLIDSGSMKSGIFIQLGAYSKKINAHSMEQRVQDIIPTAVVNVVPSIDRKIYFVQLGPLYSHALVNDLVKDLSRGGVKNYRGVVN